MGKQRVRQSLTVLGKATLRYVMQPIVESNSDRSDRQVPVSP